LTRHLGCIAGHVTDLLHKIAEASLETPIFFTDQVSNHLWQVTINNLGRFLDDGLQQIVQNVVRSCCSVLHEAADVSKVGLFGCLNLFLLFLIVID